MHVRAIACKSWKVRFTAGSVPALHIALRKASTQALCSSAESELSKCQTPPDSGGLSPTTSITFSGDEGQQVCASNDGKVSSQSCPEVSC